MQSSLTFSSFWLLTILLPFYFLFPFTLSSQDQIGDDLTLFLSSRYCGSSVAVSADGNRVAYGCRLDRTGGSSAGAVWVMELDNGSWVPVGNPMTGIAGDGFGWSSALSSDGNTIVIGGHTNSTNGFLAGVARVYRFNGSDWIQIGDDILGGERDRLGSAVAISADGSTFAIGAPDDYTANPTRKGTVEVFQLGANDYTKIGNTILGADQWAGAGNSLGLSGDGSKLIVGSDEFFINGYPHGMVEVLELGSNDTWQVLGSTLTGLADNNQFGSSVSISDSGNRIAVGDSHSDVSGNNRGAVYVYDWNGNDWTASGNSINVTGSGIGFFGSFVKLSGSGEFLVAAAEFGSTFASGGGNVRFFEFQNSEWVQKGITLQGDDSYDYFGKSVDISDNGTTMILGAPNNDEHGSNSGKAQVYDFFQVLPVTYGLFTAQASDKTVSLHWESVTEEDNWGFEIQRQVSSDEWEILGFVRATNRPSSNEYNFTDNNPVDGINFYRLKQTDYSGEFAYSDVLSVSFRSTNNQEMVVSPNPISSNLLSVRFSSTREKHYRIINYSGRIVAQGVTRSELLEVALECKPGLYGLIVKTGANTLFSKIIVAE